MKIKFSLIVIIALLFITISTSAQTEKNLDSCYENLRAKKISKAIEFCSMLIESRGDSASAYSYRGIAYLYSGDTVNYAKAKSDFEKCIKLDPLHSQCHFWLGYIAGKAYGRDDISLALIESNNKILSFAGGFEESLFQGLPETLTSNEVRLAYEEALIKNNGYRLLRIAKIENENQLLIEIKAGDILNRAYEVGLRNLDSNLLLDIAIYENQENLMDVKAGDILYSAYKIALSKSNLKSLVGIAIFENDKNLMPAVKAGDILYSAYTIARTEKDVNAMLRIADYEREFNIMKISAEEIRREALSIYK